MSPRDFESITNTRVRLATAERVQQNLEANADSERKNLTRAMARVNTAAVAVRDLREHLAKLEGHTVTANAGASGGSPDVHAFNAAIAGNGIDDERRQRLARSMWVKLQSSGQLRVRGNASNADELSIADAFVNAGLAVVKTTLGDRGVVVVPVMAAAKGNPPVEIKKKSLIPHRPTSTPHFLIIFLQYGVASEH